MLAQCIPLWGGCIDINSCNIKGLRFIYVFNIWWTQSKKDFFVLCFLLTWTDKKKKRRNKQANVLSGQAEKELTALRSVGNFCDFTDSLWRSSLRVSVSIDRDKTCITWLSFGCWWEDKVKITEHIPVAGRWGIKYYEEHVLFLLYYSCLICLLL